MQWDKAELWVGYISKEGDVYRKICIAGGDPTLVESPSEPKWSSNGDLFFVTDRNNGFWNIYKWVTLLTWQSGKSYLGILDDAQNSLTVVDVPFTDIGNVVSGSDCIYVEGATGVLPLSIAKVTLDQSKVEAVDFSIMWSSSPDSRKYRSNFSIPEPIEFQPRYQASDEEKPPLLLTVHGGPTAETRGILDLNVQYWTSQGWAVVDVNYGGSTGYGREYRQRLLGNWDILSKPVPPCLISDLNSMNEEMPPKFELHYTSNLGGSDKDMFERSPINFVDKFSCPVILFQGLDDKIVTPVQARKIHKALKQKGLPVALVEYEGEQHGFHKAENIKHSLEQQMMFFARLIGHFKVADEITPIKIDNLD
ncbi:hypothetical protein MKW98_025682 [Papaver atlanticum]|uniref:Peptidase S9 prolyl oligopeptidase catalytic domain-containing protein n=1 Tax=Papaver atlanticum TaxID=357466 RepID=A0AAD4XD96_9MAGN|nr:hypothetical protein MKW98_025682 [Papaver atlanticum]